MKLKIIITISVLLISLSARPFVRRDDATPAPYGLDGRIIALWPSHGVYYNIDEDRWKFQRARLFGTVEDLYSESYVVPLLIPMLENAGAYVMTPRERDYNSEEIIIDNDGGEVDGHPTFHNGTFHWQTDKTLVGFGLPKRTICGSENPFRAGTVRTAATVTDANHQSTARWNAPIPRRDKYAVYISYATTPTSATDARYRVNTAAGPVNFTIDQTRGGGTWIYLGTFPFDAGRNDEPLVELSNVSASAGRTVTADAVKIGGGTGNIERGGRTSGHPRHNEGARYWLQWAGMPDSVYTVTDRTNDYIDDYKSRALWVNYLTGGSSKYPDAPGLGIPVDLSFAFHTDAGVTADGSTVGTLAIVRYGKKDTLGNGEPRSTATDYAEAVAGQIVNDIRRIYDPQWNHRPTRNRSYHEAATPVVPALLIELLSHQNFTDMKLGLNPEFRFDVCRAIYKGILRYLAIKDGRKVVIQPLPVNSFGISGKDNDYILSWHPTVDSLESTAKPDNYIIEQRINDGPFITIATVEDPWYPVNISTDDIYSYRITALNAGGRSFPSEILSLCRKGCPDKQMLIVNAFTRLSGPDIIDLPEIQGMDYATDHGVSLGRDASFTGEQTQFKPGIEWSSDDSPGSGASRADFDRNSAGGNDFDNVYRHGKALAAAGIPFISASREAFVNSLPDVRSVDIIFGKQKETAIGICRRHKTFTPDLQLSISRLTERGVNIIVSGSYIASDVFDNPHSSVTQKADDSRWLRETLGYRLETVKATRCARAEKARSKFTSLAKLPEIRFTQTYGDFPYAVESPDALMPSGSGNGAVVMRYADNGFPAAVATEMAGYKTIAIGFPLETVTEQTTLSKFFSSAIDFFDAPAAPATVKNAVEKPKTSAKPKTTKPKKKKSKRKK